MIDYIKHSWFSLLMLVLGIFFIAGYFGFWRDQAARCTEPVTATISRSDEVTVTDENGTHYEYQIAAEYEVDGETYVYSDTTKTFHDVGDAYKLVYNPEDPGEAMTPGRAKTMWLVPVVGFAMVAFFPWSQGWFKRRSSHSNEH